MVALEQGSLACSAATAVAVVPQPQSRWHGTLPHRGGPPLFASDSTACSRSGQKKTTALCDIVCGATKQHATHLGVETQSN